MSSSKIDSRIRQVAVLLTSVDGQTARQLLSQFPTEQARQIRQAMVHLGSVSVEERRKALELFQQMTGSAKGESNSKSGASSRSPAESLAMEASEGMDRVEISKSAQRHSQNTATYHHAGSSESYGGDPSGALSDGSFSQGSSENDTKREMELWHQLDADDLSELLLGERAILIAIVLNQVPVAFASKLLSALPKQAAVDALAVLPQLQTTPADILHELHQHLRKKIADYQLPKRTAEQNLQKLQAILNASDESLRNDCMQRVQKEMPYVAKRLGWSVDDSHFPSGSISANTASGMARGAPSDPMSGALNAEAGLSPAEQIIAEQEAPTLLPFPVASQATPASQSLPGQEIGASPISTSGFSMSWEEVALLPTVDLATVLRATDPALILLALSGASEAMYQRVRAMLHPRETKRLDAKMSSMGAVQLRDIDQAQKWIAKTATELLAQGQIGSLSSMTITAAA